ncbi:MAG: winged helix-turn-helix domain-containing protein [Actinobacteria bacterium]|nr:winged helix-turn-helix domain-containing protein [Actinomycetota bacterium]
MLGPLEVLDHGQPVHVPGSRARSLLTLLALRAGTVVPRDRLIDELWGDRPPANAANALQARVSRLRRLLGPVRLLGRAPGYLLAIDPEDVDVTAFEQLAGRDATSGPGRGRQRCCRARLASPPRVPSAVTGGHGPGRGGGGWGDEHADEGDGEAGDRAGTQT